MNTKRIGNIGEAKVLAKLVELGIPVYIPFGDDEKADLVADFNGKLQKIQVKTSERVMDGYYTVDLRSCKNHKTTPETFHYTSNDIDYFATYNIERDTICLIDINEAPSAAVRLRFMPPANGQQKGLRFEKDFLIETVLNK